MRLLSFGAVDCRSASEKSWVIGDHYGHLRPPVRFGLGSSNKKWDFGSCGAFLWAHFDRTGSREREREEGMGGCGLRLRTGRSCYSRAQHRGTSMGSPSGPCRRCPCAAPSAWGCGRVLGPVPSPHRNEAAAGMAGRPLHQRRLGRVPCPGRAHHSHHGAGISPFPAVQATRQPRPSQGRRRGRSTARVALAPRRQPVPREGRRMGPGGALCLARGVGAARVAAQRARRGRGGWGGGGHGPRCSVRRCRRRGRTRAAALAPPASGRGQWPLPIPPRVPPRGPSPASALENPLAQPPEAASSSQALGGAGALVGPAARDPRGERPRPPRWPPRPQEQASRPEGAQRLGEARRGPRQVQPGALTRTGGVAAAPPPPLPSRPLQPPLRPCGQRPVGPRGKRPWRGWPDRFEPETR